MFLPDTARSNLVEVAPGRGTADWFHQETQGTPCASASLPSVGCPGLAERPPCFLVARLSVYRRVQRPPLPLSPGYLRCGGMESAANGVSALIDIQWVSSLIRSIQPNPI